MEGTVVKEAIAEAEEDRGSEGIRNREESEGLVGEKIGEKPGGGRSGQGFEQVFLRRQLAQDGERDPGDVCIQWDAGNIDPLEEEGNGGKKKGENQHRLIRVDFKSGAFSERS